MRSLTFQALVAPLVIALSVCGARADCTPQWNLQDIEDIGTVGDVFDVELWNDGSGEAIFVAGGFGRAGIEDETFGIAKWDGDSWSPLPSPLPPLSAYNDLIIHNDGSGEKLYAVGTRIRSWDGLSWSGVGGTDGEQFGSIEAAAEFQGDLYIAGGFSPSIGGQFIDGIARWDGSSWHPVGFGTLEQIRTMAVHTDGNGTSLYVAGDLSDVGGVSVQNIARWDGSQWHSVGSGLSGRVNELLSYDDGTGSKLYAVGSFSSAGAVSTPSIAVWDGTTWSTLGTGMTTGNLWSIGTYQGTIYVGGGFLTVPSGATANNLTRWNGAIWEPVTGTNISTPGLDSKPLVIREFTFKGDSLLFIGGEFNRAEQVAPMSNSGIILNHITAYDGNSWQGFGNGGLSGDPDSMVVHDDGTGAKLYATGSSLNSVGNVAVNIGGDDGIAVWDGDAWSALPGLFDSSLNGIASLDTGTGSELYAFGPFLTVDGLPLQGVARWTGSGWTQVGSTPLLGTTALTVHNDGTGQTLWAADFTDGLYRLDGNTWTLVTGPINDRVNALLSTDLGSGQVLIVGGKFSDVAGTAARSLATWDGSTWSPLGGGFGASSPAEITDLATYEGQLYAGGIGRFWENGTVESRGIARWDGTSWEALPSQFAFQESVYDLAVFNDGLGERLWVCGNFRIENGSTIRNVAKWNGSTWEALDGPGPFSEVTALAVHSPASDSVGGVFIGGQFSELETDAIGTLRTVRIAHWLACDLPCPGDIANGDGMVDVDDLNAILSVFGTSVGIGNSSDIANNDGLINIDDLNVILANFGATCG